MMQRLWRNHAATFSACPVLGDMEAHEYLLNGTIPDAGMHYIEVPPGKIIRNRGVWLTPSYKAHYEGTMFLISADVYEMNVDALEDVRSQIYCYFSETAGVHYLGRLNFAAQRNGAPEALLPLIEGLHAPILIADLKYEGRVIAAS